MLLKPDQSWAIITPPKTGSTTLSQFFAPYYSGHQHDTTLPEGFTGKVYVTTREPFSRALSLWWHYLWSIATPLGSYPLKIIKQYPLNWFLKERRTMEPFYGPATYWTQGVIWDILLPLETLNPDLVHYGILKEGEQLPHLNKTNHQKPEAYYTPETIEIVQADFKEDFRNFAYSTTPFWIN
jgi:hypothetical protein